MVDDDFTDAVGHVELQHYQVLRPQPVYVIDRLSDNRHTFGG
jgi:hypothetical protein